MLHQQFLAEYSEGKAGYRIKDVADAAAIAQRLYEQLNEASQEAYATTLNNLQEALEKIYNDIKGENDDAWSVALSRSLNEPTYATTLAGTGDAEVNPESIIGTAVNKSAEATLTAKQKEGLDYLSDIPIDSALSL